MKARFQQLIPVLFILVLTSCANQKYYSYLKKVNQNSELQYADGKSEQVDPKNQTASVGPAYPGLSSGKLVKLPTAHTVKLNAGTPIPLGLVNTVSTASYQPGTPINFRVLYDVKVGDDVVIRNGSTATGNVISYQKPKGVGKAGSITVQVNSVQAVDGTVIPISSNSLSDTGTDNTVLVIILVVLFVWVFLLGLLFLMIKGGDAAINVGTQVQGMVSTDTTIKVE